MDIYEKIQYLCKENKISVRQLERELQFGNNTIGKWKTSKPSIDKLQLVANYFNKPIDLFNRPGIYLGTDSTLGLSNLICKVAEQSTTDSNNTAHILIADEPEITLHSKAACDLIVYLKNMDEENIEFLVETAQRINPKKKKKIVVVENPNNKKMPPATAMAGINGSMNNSSIIQPFTTVKEAKKYLESLGSSVAAFNGGVDLSDKSIIEMANIIYKDKNKN